MAFDGDRCEKLGTYKSECCAIELVIAQGARFPRCQNHPGRPTEWRLLPELTRDSIKLGKKIKK